MSEDWNSCTASHRTPGPADMDPAPPALPWQLPPVTRPFPELPSQMPPFPVFHLPLTLHHPLSQIRPCLFLQLAWALLSET